MDMKPNVRNTNSKITNFKKAYLNETIERQIYTYIRTYTHPRFGIKFCKNK